MTKVAFGRLSDPAGRLISRHSPLPSFQFLCSTWNPVSSPRPAVLQSRRAQELSRLAVAPTLRRTPALPGHTLTASSTTARLMRSGRRSEGSLPSGAGHRGQAVEPGSWASAPSDQSVTLSCCPSSCRLRARRQRKLDANLIACRHYGEEVYEQVRSHNEPRYGFAPQVRHTESRFRPAGAPDRR